jgi:hypothetical protein
MNWEMFVIGQALVLAGAMIKIWNDSEVKIARLQERLTSAEDKDATLFKKLDYISAQLTDLSIQLSNKQDK